MFLLAAMLFGARVSASDMFSPKLRGDVGLGGYATMNIVEGVPDRLSVLPYLDCSYDRLFARVDTFGIKTMQAGYGHLELVTRFSQDGFNTDNPALNGLTTRNTSFPVGLGTLQVTPIGGVFLNVFHDINKSHGNWIELIYGAKFKSMGVVFYPLLGFDYQSAEYVGYYYGVTAQESLNSGLPSYRPSAATNVLYGLIADLSLDEHWHLNAYLRRKQLDASIYQSPIVKYRFLDTAYLALSYRY